MSKPKSHDMIREFRLRRWARQHYVPSAERESTWDALVLEEMACRDAELAADLSVQSAIGPASDCRAA